MTTTTPDTATREWGIEAVDVDAYLDRIDHLRLPPSPAALRSMMAAHIRAIPFENVDVLIGHPGISLAAITAKLVGRRRGGYCYEHALLFAAVLERLGYTVERRMARVQPGGSGLHTHMLLVAHAGGEPHLVDIGFGAGMMYPMPLRDGAVVDQAGWEHRLDRVGPLWTLSKRTADGDWEVLHEHDEAPQRPADYEVAHHYVSTHPRSPFTGQLVVMRLEPGVSKRLVGGELTVEYADGRVERTPVPVEDIDRTLRQLDVELEPAELAALLTRLS
ncbi:arylamine N-acetyltransferase family protein [Amycolatopsis suaedae]|uniref:Arylamine N-acetyltransferase n=1 Tax=Amycolatopsis suaedae TaxID=2510978 RepID=A0A4Q7JFJ9_9PSEU|nr:arylamine N-acetyltransferase [Amycolatopsis suaedae]RZQ65982.1 arylamine N-acetyltransferase [Amycolatopsis suaedae]